MIQYLRYPKKVVSFSSDRNMKCRQVNLPSVTKLVRAGLQILPKLYCQHYAALVFSKFTSTLGENQ